MNDTTDMAGLIRELESAAEGSRELDCAIVKAICPDCIINFWPTGDSELHAFHAGELLGVNKAPVPHYTTSLDAALTLVPEGWHIGTGGLREVLGHGWDCTLWASYPARRVDTGMDETGRNTGLSPTPALSLCIAALKARSQ